MTHTPLKNNSESSSTSTLNIVLYVILGIVAIAITAIIAFLHFKTLKQQRDKKRQQRENAMVEPTENHQQHNENEESIATITTENDNSAAEAEAEDATTRLFGNRYVSSDMGKEEEISFEGTHENPIIKYSAAQGSTSLLGKENNNLYFLNAPAVKYYMFNINENGFSLKNPDGKIQTFMMIDTD
jgi:cytoskeletal protein RodZ